MEILTTQQIEELKNSAHDWHYLNLRDFYKRLNRALRTTSIQEHYDRVTRAYWDLHRWEILTTFDLKHLLKPLQLRDGQTLIRPMDADGSDWRWDIVGRPPLFFDYCCARACHWMSEANYQLAVQMFPEIHWEIISNQYHTSVLNREHKLLFDLNYFAMKIPAPEAVEMLIRVDEDSDDLPVLFENGSDYSCSELTMTEAAIRFWKVVDGLSGTEEEKFELVQKARTEGVVLMDKASDVEKIQVAKPLAELACYGG